MKINCYKPRLIFSLLVLLVLTYAMKSHADSSINLHAGVGAGLRYGFATFPFPLIHINKSMDDSIVFIEAALTPMIITGSIGYARKISNKSSIKVAVIKAWTISHNISGYKWSYVYNSNSFNGRGWETSIELYSIKSKAPDTANINRQTSVPNSSESSKKYLFPSVSFGYIW